MPDVVGLRTCPVSALTRTWKISPDYSQGRPYAIEQTVSINITAEMDEAL
jgi:hypothetical protein